MPEFLKDINILMPPIFKGGQKEVFKGIHPQLGLVAVKKGTYDVKSTLERIIREVDCLKEIDSPYFPKNHYFSVDEFNKSFTIVEEYIESINLSEAKLYFDTEVKLIVLLKNLLMGLQILWNKNIIHRDIKPDNILIIPNMEPRIIDLGIARFLDYSDLTKTMYPMGPCTPVYASPEQLLNKKEIIDMRTDFFSIGIIILELWHGFHPFHPEKVNNDTPIPVNICSTTYVKPELKEGTSMEFAYLINRLLKKQPYERFRNYQMILDYINKNWGET